MGAPGASYQTYAPTVAAGANVWVVFDPVATSSTSWPIGAFSYTLKIYVQTTEPTASSTPVLTEEMTSTRIESLFLFTRGGNSKIRDLVFASRDVDGTFAPSRTVKMTQVPVVSAFGPASDPATATTNVQSGIYLGTDKTYEADEGG